MWARIEDGEVVQTISTAKALTINNIQYPSSIFTSSWTDEERKAIGILPYEYAGSYINNMFYTTYEAPHSIQDDKVLVTRLQKAREVSDIKDTMKAHIENVLKSYLEQTDWIVIREQDNGTAKPADLAKWRDDLRAKAKALETAIDSKGDVSGLEALTIPTEAGESSEFDDWPLDPRRKVNN
tara:strand:+ start:761 stop:1306 length:546 start_codon:yes stop_codon:yes gene_type:complete